MSLRPPQRWLLLSSTLVLSVVAAAWEGTESAAPVVLPVDRPAATLPRPLAADAPIDPEPRLALEKLQRTVAPPGDDNPFLSTSWYVPPPPPPPPPPPAKPTAPPLPFRFLGVIEHADGNWSVQLAHGSEFLVVGKDDTIDDVYRVEGIADGQLVFRYLPLSTRQTLPLPATE